MNCREFEANLHLLLVDGPPTMRLAAARDHASSCPSCGRLLALARGEIGPVTPDLDDALTASILQRTGGAACAGVGERFCAWMDGEADGPEAELLLAHIARCGTCNALAETLRALGTELPGLAEVEPDGWFVGDVMARTARRRFERRSPLTALRRRCRVLMRRPRIAQEIAYAAAITVLLFWGPRAGRMPAGSPGDLAVAPIRAAADFVRAFDRLSALPAAIADQGEIGWTLLHSREFRERAPAVRRIYARTARALAAVGASGGDIARAVRRMDGDAARGALLDLPSRVLDAWRGAPTEPSPDGARIQAREQAPIDADPPSRPHR